MLQKNTIITAECLCKSHTFSTEVDTSKLPLISTVCHCDSCRHSTGALFVIETTWPQSRESIETSGLVKYQITPNIANFFCGICSTMIFYESKKLPSKLGLYSGSLKNINADLLKLTKHKFVEDTRDGGATVWLRRPNADGKEIPRYREYSGDMSWDWPGTSNLTRLGEKEQQKAIPIWCHCKGIQLLLHRGNYASKEKEGLPWFIDPKTLKPLANFDVCDSSRLQFGFEIVNWTYAELVNISGADGSEFPKTTSELSAAVDAQDPVVGTLAYYRTSSDVQRYFCKVCSAAAFYASDDRSDIVRLAIGLIEAPDGARAEELLSWNFGDIPLGVDDVRGGWRESLVERVQADAEEFRIRRDYPKSWRRLEENAKAGPSDKILHKTVVGRGG